MMKTEFIPYTSEFTSNEIYIQYMTVFEEVKRYRDSLSFEVSILYGYMKRCDETDPDPFLRY